jgi:hypothetical protein
MKRLPPLRTYIRAEMQELKSANGVAGGRVRANRAAWRKPGRNGTGNDRQPGLKRQPKRPWAWGQPQVAGNRDGGSAKHLRRRRQQLHRADEARAAAQRLEGQSAASNGSAQAGPQRARDKDTSRGPMRPPANPGGRRKPTRTGGRVERKGPAPVASRPGRAEMTSDAKVPWKCARPAAAAPADEAVSAGADRTAHVLRKEGHDTVAAGGNTSGH